jgi:sugar/nucleoside kinase (ribokinase family)
MFLAAGPRADAFCEAVRRLGERAEPLGDRLPPDLVLLHVDAASLLAAPDRDALRASLDAARLQGALISIDLGPAAWIRENRSSRTAYQLATIQPDILFASAEAAAELATPLEGIASVPVLSLGPAGCSVYGRRVAAEDSAAWDPNAFMAAFCVAFVEGSAPVEAAGRAVLVAAAVLA